MMDFEVCCLSAEALGKKSILEHPISAVSGSRMILVGGIHSSTPISDGSAWSGCESMGRFSSDQQTIINCRLRARQNHSGVKPANSPLALWQNCKGGRMTKQVVHCKRDSYDVYIGRPSEFGNPHKMRSESERAKVIEAFEKTARMRIAVDQVWADKIKGLHGKTLGCWCAPKPCHGDVLVKLAKELNNDQAR